MQFSRNFSDRVGANFFHARLPAVVVLHLDGFIAATPTSRWHSANESATALTAD
jgi:hypothetical protein